MPAVQSDGCEQVRRWKSTAQLTPDSHRSPIGSAANGCANGDDTGLMRSQSPEGNVLSQVMFQVVPRHELSLVVSAWVTACPRGDKLAVGHEDGCPEARS